MSSIRSIMEGIKNSINFSNLPEEDQLLITQRREICAACPFNSQGTIPECKLCGCIIKYKTASLSETCGAQEYNEDEPDSLNHKEVKWYAKTKD